jgi:hypothetical protein
MAPKTVRRIRAKVQSCSPLTKGQIIAQPIIRPIVSQGGYHQKGIRQALNELKTREEFHSQKSNQIVKYLNSNYPDEEFDKCPVA